MNKYAIYAIIIIFAGGHYLSLRHQRDMYRAESKRSTTRLREHNDSIITVYNIRGEEMYQKAATIVHSTVKELQTYDSQVVKSLEKMNVRLKRMEHYQETGFKTIVDIKANARDTTFVVNNIEYKGRVLSHIDPNVTFNALDDGTKLAKVYFALPDTLKTVLVKGKREKKFLFVRYGDRVNELRMTNTNPYIEIDYNRYIKMTKP